MAGTISPMELEDIAEKKCKLFVKFLELEPPLAKGEDLDELWAELYDDTIKSVVVETTPEYGPSDDQENPVFPYEKLQAVVKDGGNWKWPRMWQKFDEVERRGFAFREGEKLNFGQANKAPNSERQRVLVVGGGPIGLRMAIELCMGGHQVTVFEKRRELTDSEGNLTQLGFTNRINRPHMWPFVRNDLAKLNGKEFMSRQSAYPVFTEPDTSSIGVDELQCLLLKNALLLGVDFRLGVSYDDSKVVTKSRKTCMPSWDVDCTYDNKAAERFGKRAGKQVENYDCLVGCDGPRSTVREKQGKYFGNIEKRKFMDCVGIVANVQKVSRKRLKELGFEHGQEPGDMNRTRMVFKDFFKKISNEADADIENLIYYKASHHNYTILVPKRADLIKHGLSGKVYHFHAGRDNAASAAKTAEKQKLKDYCRRVLQAAGVPIDDKLENGGFVGVPNDCMAFDFAECWNTQKSMFFNLPGNDYDTELDGPWQGRTLTPLVALCGDSLMEPFWPMGLGLKRGWQAVMDTCYAVDNLYNTAAFSKKLGKPSDEVTWDEHFELLKEQVASNFEMCNRLKVAAELGKGEYDPKGPIVMQLKKKFKDPEIPPYEVEVDPWTRYDQLAKEAGDEWKLKIDDDTWLHPKVSRAMAMKDHYDEISKNGKNGEISYTGKKLVSIMGRAPDVSGGNAGTNRVPRKKAGAKAKSAGMGMGDLINAAGKKK